MCKSPRIEDEDDVKQGLLKCHVPKRLDRLSIISLFMLKRVIITYFLGVIDEKYLGDQQ